MTRNQRALILSAAALVMLVLLGLWITQRSASRATTVQSRASTTTDMAAMPGMDGAASGTVALTSDQIRQFGVTFGVAALRPLSNEIRTVGTVVVNETRVAKVTPKFSGYVEQLYASFVGQSVRRGQPLAAIFSPELVAAEQELLVASRLSRTSGGSVPGVPDNSIDLTAAARQRLRLWDVPDVLIDEILRKGQPVRTVPLVSPVSGAVIEKNVVEGQAVQAGEELYTIADLSDVWVEAQLREEDAGRAAIGASASLEFTSYPGRQFSGRVSYLDPVFGAQTRTLRARITVPNPNGIIKPGMYATVVLNSSSTQSALTVPRSAVVQTGERALVFVDVGSGQLKAQPVALGRSGGDYVEVLSGVSPGQRVVTSAQFLIDSESNLGEVMRGMIGQGGGNAPMSNMQAAPAADVNAKGADMRGMPGMSPPPKK